jgi:hypothetical protein
VTSHPLSVRHRARVRLGGPPSEEATLRGELARRVSTLLRQGCARFGATRQPEIWAARIADDVPYVKARRSACEILELRVDYRNRTLSSAGRWKVWVDVKDDEDQASGTAGEYAGRWKP